MVLRKRMSAMRMLLPLPGEGGNVSSWPTAVSPRSGHQRLLCVGNLPLVISIARLALPPLVSGPEPGCWLSEERTGTSGKSQG